MRKITNWFRNLRQTSRRRAKKIADEDEDDTTSVPNAPSFAGSRTGSPSFRSSSSSSANEDYVMDIEDDARGAPSDAGSEEDYQEAVTPPLDSSPSPRAFSPTPTVPSVPNMGINFDPSAYVDLAKKAYPGVKIEDALLLLSFAMH